MPIPVALVKLNVCKTENIVGQNVAHLLCKTQLFCSKTRFKIVVAARLSNCKVQDLELGRLPLTKT